MKSLNKSVISFIFLSMSLGIYAQRVVPLEIGDKVPSDIWKTIPKKAKTQLVILDFWSTNCSKCIAAFPKMEQLQREFEEDIQIVLVNCTENDAKIKERFDKFNKGRSKDMQIALPTLPSISGKKEYKDLFTYQTVPHHVWINKESKIIAITNGYNATSSNVKSAIKGNVMNLHLKDDVLSREILKNGYLKAAIENSPPIYYSAFIPFLYTTSAGNNIKIDSVKKTYRIIQINRNPIQHFQLAFKKDQEPERIIYELNEKNRFALPKDSNLWDDWLGTYYFNYEIQGRLDDLNTWQIKMQADANYFFGNLFGIEALLEKRDFKSLSLIKIKAGLLKTNEEKGKSVNTDTIREWINQPFRKIVSDLQYRFEDWDNLHPFIDETGFTGNVNIRLTGNLKDLQNIKQQLQQYGLDIIETERKIEVLVIRDKPGWQPSKK